MHCTYQDNLVNVYGIDPETRHARSPWDNEGIQYGLETFNDGIITFDQFAELNRRIGGHDIDGVIVPEQRARANPDAVRIAYETGRLNTGQGGLRNIPILDIRGYTDGICTVAPCPPRDPTDVDVHDGYHTPWSRARACSRPTETQTTMSGLWLTRSVTEDPILFSGSFRRRR